MDQGRDDNMKWIPQDQGIRYLGLLLALVINFEKLLQSIKVKLISWSSKKLSLANKTLVVNQVLLASIQVTTTYQSPISKMCRQLKEFIKNFMWGGHVEGQGGKLNGTLLFSRKNEKVQEFSPLSSNALLAKLLIRVLTP